MNNNTKDISIGLVSISDRAYNGTYPDLGIPALQDWLASAITSPYWLETRLIPDDREQIEKTLRELVDEDRCSLILTTGGTGPSRRDQTPEADTAQSVPANCPASPNGCARSASDFVPTAVLSRQVAVICERPDHAALILNLPGRPAAIRQTLEGVRDAGGNITEPGIFTAIPYCIELIGGPAIETNDTVCKAWRPETQTN